MMRKNVSTGLSLLLVVWCLFFAANDLKAQTVPQNIVLRTLEGAEVTVGNELSDSVTIVSFWATWCKPCQTELEALLDLEDDWKGKVRIVAVSIDDSRAVAKVKSLVRGKKWPYEILLDQNRDFYKALNLTAIPYVMVIDNGRIIWSHSGYVPGNESVVVDKALEALESRSK